jgi:hypothetical protein
MLTVLFKRLKNHDLTLMKHRSSYPMLTCPEHPENEATYQCESCGKQYCDLCVKENGYDTVVCTECELLVADLLDLI